MLANQNQNRNQNNTRNTNENTSEYTTPESTNSGQNISQTETSTTTQFVRIPTRNIESRHNTQDPQPSSNISSQRYITFEIPSSPTEELQNETQNTNSIPNTSVNVMSPTRNNPTTSRNFSRSTYDPPSVPSIYREPNTTRQTSTTTNRQYDPFRYTFFQPSNTNISTNTQHKESSQNNNLSITTQHPYEHFLQPNTTQQNLNSLNQNPHYINTKHTQRTRNPPLSHIPTDPLYQQNHNSDSNATNIPQPITHTTVMPPYSYIPFQQDTFINTSASIPEPMKPFDGLDHSYTPEEYLQQVEARLTFAIGEEPQNNPVKYRSWHNRRMAYIQWSLIGTALDWYTNLHISYKQQWNSFVQLFKKQFSSQKTAYYAQVEAMSLMKKDNETVRHFALRVQQLVKKGWCNESPSTINLKNNEIFTKDYQKN